MFRWLLVFFPILCFGQKVQVIVPDEPVVMGTAFQVQYICTEPAGFVSASVPVFDSCRIVSGPNVYRGNAFIDGKQQPIQNIAYTLVPLAAGQRLIGSIVVNYSNGRIESGSARLQVVPPPKASFTTRSSLSDPSLSPPADPAARRKLIEENLFMVVETDRRSVFVGQPLIVTFKLYSRMQSSSEAEKSPSFYGFSIMDMLPITESHNSVETRDGKLFNTSVIRKVQLFPVQSGKLSIDPMYVSNEISFRDSASGRSFTEIHEIITPVIEIDVKPLPAGQPPGFSGAVGQFTLKASLARESIAQNEQGKLLLAVYGKGNFMQFSSPAVSWPSSLESFEPIIQDSLAREQAPLSGSRLFTFSFIADSTGRYTIPPPVFSYFDPNSGQYVTLSSNALEVEVTAPRKRAVLPAVMESGKGWWIISVGLMLLLTIAWLVWKRKPRASKELRKESPPEPSFQSLVKALDLDKSPSEYYLQLQQLILSQINKQQLSATQKTALKEIADECALLLYAMGNEDRKQELRERTNGVIGNGE